MPPANTPEPQSPADVAATFCATLVDEWIVHGVRHAMIAPGSRSTPMALALTDRAELAVHVFHDERAAAFAALGAGLHGSPAVALCTSGTAAAHFHAAVIEAHQSSVPMIVCTADRPPELRDVGAPQTIDQTQLFGASVRWFHAPGVAAMEAAPTWRSLAAHAYGSATGVWPGPVHLNLAFREPLVGSPGELPRRRAAGGVSVPSKPGVGEREMAELARLVDHERGVLVAGRGCGDAHAVAALSEVAGWPVLADARSGLRHIEGVCVASADHLLRSAHFAETMRPDVVVRLGEPPASKVVNQWLAASASTQVHVGATPVWIDPDATMARRVVADPAAFCTELARLVTHRSGHWYRQWIEGEREAQSRFQALLAGPGALSEPAVARAIATMLPAGSQLVASSSMPIRDLEWFGSIPAGVTVHANRGANGIDGVIATAIGVAVDTGAPTCVLIGDVAFLHDSSALTALGARQVDLRIVVIDNDGGGIFSFLPQAGAIAPGRFEQLFGTPHGTDLVALAAAHGLPATTVTSLAELRAAVARAGPSVTVVHTDRAENVAVHQALNPVL